MRKFDSINVIPFIDIMLVLLAIVLTTATFISAGQLDIVLPESGAATVAIEKQAIELAMDQKERLYLDGKPATIADIELHLQTSDKKTPVILLIDEAVDFGHFIVLIDLLKDREPERVYIRTRAVP